MKLTEAELASMLREIAHAEATRYYKLEEVNPPSLIVKSVFMVIVGVVSIQLTRAGVTEDQLAALPLVDDIAREMRLVGWNLDGLANYVNAQEA